MLKERSLQLFGRIRSQKLLLMTSAPELALIYLERFTLDYLKIDRGFINAIGTGNDPPVLDAVLTLAKRLNMLTVAEGSKRQNRSRWPRNALSTFVAVH